MALYVLDELHDESLGVAGDPHTIPERTRTHEDRRTELAAIEVVSLCLHIWSLENGSPNYRGSLPLEHRVLPIPDKGSVQDLPAALQTNQATKSTGTIQSYSNSTRAGMYKNENKKLIVKV
jgi:hypothetical protein